MLLNLEYRTQYIYSFVPDILRLVDLAFDSMCHSRLYRGPLEAHHVAPMGAPTWALAPLWRTTTRLFGMPPGHFGRGAPSMQL